MKKIFALIMAIAIFGCPIGAVYADNAAEETLIENGDFSENTDGWYGLDGANAGFSADEGHDAAGSLSVISESAQSSAETAVNLRKYKWYHLSLYVKLADTRTREGSFFLAPQLAYTDGEEEKTTALFDRVLLQNNTWTRVEGYFQAPMLSNVAQENTVEDLFLAGSLQLIPEFSGEESAFASFYADDVQLTAIDGGMNGDFGAGIQYWNFEGTETRISFQSAAAEDEQLATLDQAGIFPETDNIYRFAPNTSGTSCIGPSQNIAMDSGTDYEISVWLKGENVQKGDNAFLVLDRSFNGTRYGDNVTAIGKVDISDGKWHRIKAVENFPTDAVRKSGDAAVYVCISNGSRYNSNNASGRNILMAQFEVRKRGNLIRNPYFIITGKEARSLDHQAVKQPESMEPWQFDGTLNVEYNPERTYDASKYYAMNTVEDSGDLQCVRQTVQFSAKDYTLSVWARLDESYPADTAEGYLYVDDSQSPLSEQYSLNKNEWTKLEVPVYSAAEGERMAGLAVRNEEILEAPRSILLSDFTILENNESFIDVTDISVNGTFDPEGEFPEITVKTNPAKKGTLFYEYLLYDPAGGQYTAIQSGQLENFRSGDILPGFEIFSEWTGMKLKIRAYMRNSKGEIGQEYSTDDYQIRKNKTDDDTVIPFNSIFRDNGIANGTFEQGVDGWTPEGAAQLQWDKTVAADQSVGCAAIKQTAGKGDGISTDFRIRRYRQYKFSADVKLKEQYSTDTKIQATVVFDNNGAERTINLGTVVLNHTDWAKLEGSFILNMSLEDLSGAAPEENLYRNGKVVFRAARVKEMAGDSNLTEFYLDNVFLLPVNESTNPYLGENREGWSDRTSAQTVSLNPAQEGIEELIQNGEFPNVSRCVKITSAAGAFADSPQQTFYMDADKKYEVSAWVKSEDLNEDQVTEPAPDYIELILGRKGSTTYTCHGRIAVSDGKWHHIKAVISYPKSAAEDGYQGDALMFLRYSANNGNVYGSAPSESKTFYVAELGIRELNNAVTNPYFVIGDGWNYWYGHEYCGKAINNSTGRNYVTPGTAIRSGYNGDNAVEIVVDPNSAAVKLDENDVCYIDSNENFDSFDGGFAYGKMVLKSENHDSFWYTAALENSAAYKISAWIKAERDTEKNLQLVTYVGEKSNIVHTQSISANQWVKTESEPYLYTGSAESVKIGFYVTTDDGSAVKDGSILFENVTAARTDEIIPKIAVNFDRAICGSEDNTVRVTKLRDMAMGYRYQYYLSDRADNEVGKVSDAVRIVSGQSDINAVPNPFYCNLSWRGKYICAAVAPVSRFGVYGETVYTDWVRVDGGFAIKRADATEPQDGKTTAEAEIENGYSEDVWADIIFAYTNQSGEVKSIRVEKTLLRNGQNSIVTTELPVEADDKNGMITVYAWLGTKSGLTKFAPLTNSAVIHLNQ